MLEDADIDRFVTDGFVAVRGAFTRELAEACLDVLWPALGVDRHDRATWTSPVVRLTGSAHPLVLRAANAPPLHQAFDQLVGPGRWRPKAGLGTFPVRFPGEDDPGDAGWHVDGGFEHDGTYALDRRSRGRALLLLYLFTDVGPDDAPTRIRVGSHRRVATILDGLGGAPVTFMDLATRAVPATDDLPVAVATGRAGDVFLCHPFLVHAASWPHRGDRPRWIAQPALDPGPGFDVRELGCR
jgi:hypothetical protein